MKLNDSISKLDLDGVLAAEEVVAGRGARHRHEAWRWFGPCADVAKLIQGFAVVGKCRSTRTNQDPVE